MTLKKKTYANFNNEFAKVFNSDNSLPENIFNTKFHNFFVFDMDYFYEEQVGNGFYKFHLITK